MDYREVTSGGRVAILHAPARVQAVIPGQFPCGGTQLDLGGGVKVGFTRRSDGNGAGSLQVQVPPAFCSRFIQLVDASTCGVSAAVEVQ